MKKFICLLLAAGLLMLSGCGNSGNAADTSADTSAPDSGSAAQSSVQTDDTAESGGTPSGEETKVESFGNNPPIETSEYPVTEPSAEMSEEEQVQLMTENSLMSMGDTSRMANVLKKAAAGEEITIGYIGGSITEGLTAGPEKCWARLTYEALCQMYPDTVINYVNAGLSGTPSVLGVVRAERDLYSVYTPDIVFVEFAVNDGGDQINKDCYESLVRKILEKENDPAVVLLFTVLKNEYSCQPWMTMVGEHYNLPMISVGNAINPMFHAGLMDWEKYSDDESHPNYWGHELVTGFIMNYFEKVKEIADSAEAAPEIPALPEEAVFSDAYKGMKLLERDQMNAVTENMKESDNVITSFGNGWIYRASNGCSVKFTADFRTLFLVFHCNKGASFADVDVYIDGTMVNTVSTSRPGGWGNPEADIAWSGESVGTHEVELRVNEGESRYFGFAGVGICD